MPRKVRIKPAKFTPIGSSKANTYADKTKEINEEKEKVIRFTADALVATAPCASAPWSEDNPHHMSYGLQRRGGWQKHMTQNIWPLVNDLGYKRVFFHLPFGKTTGQSPLETEKRNLEAEYGIKYNDWSDEQKSLLDEQDLKNWHMSIDHMHDLERTGNEYIASDFYEALDWLHEKAPDVEVICYIGSHDWEDKTRIDNGEYGAVFLDWWRSMTPLIDRDFVSIVYDAAVGKDEDHINARLVQLTQDAKDRQGRWVGVEARIQKARPWPNDLRMTCVAWAKTWRRQAHPGNIPREFLHAPPLIVYDGHARSQVDRDYGGDWFAYMAEDFAQLCQIGPSPLGREFAGLTTTEIATKLVDIVY